MGMVKSITNNTVFKIFLFYVLILCNYSVYSQVTIQGIVLDNATMQELPYATVSIANTTVGTTSNEQGEFLLYIDDTIANKQISISYLGYKKESYNFNDILTNTNVGLDTLPYLLNEVEILFYNEKYLVNLIQKALDKKRDSKINKTNAKCLIKIITSNNNEPVEMIETLGQADLNTIDGITDISIKTGKIAYESNSNYKFFNLDFTKTLSGFSAFRKNPNKYLVPLSVCNMNKRKLKKEYVFDNQAVSQYKSEKVLNISCKTKKENSNSLNTNISIGVKSFEIYSLTCYGNIKTNTIFKPMIESHEIDSLYIEITLLFKNHPDDSAFLKNLIVEYDLNYYDTLNIHNITSRMIVNLYDYYNEFYLPKFKFSNNDNDYIKLFHLHYDSIYWYKNYFSVESDIEKEYKDYFKESGTLVNYDKNDSFDYLDSNVGVYIIWSENKLKWENINNDSNYNPLHYFDGTSYRDRQFDDDLFNIDIQIYIDVYKTDRSFNIYTESVFSKNASFYYLEKSSEALDFINLYFDIYEIARSRIVNTIKLSKTITESIIDSIYNVEINNLHVQIDRYKNEVNRGMKKENMKKWLDYVNKEINYAPKELLIPYN